MLLGFAAAADAVGERRNLHVGPRDGTPPVPPVPAELAFLGQDPDAWQDASAADRRAYVTWARVQLDPWRTYALARLEARQDARARQVNEGLDLIFSALALLALASALVPGRWWGRVRDRAPALRHRILAGVLLALLLVGLGGLVGLLAEVSSSVTAHLDPQVAGVDIAFEVLDQRLADVEAGRAPSAALPLGPVLGDLARSGDGDVIRHFLHNIERMGLDALAPLHQATVWAHQVTGWLPLIAPIFLALIFLLTIGDILRQIAGMPAQAAAGTPKAIRRALGLTLRTFIREFLAVLLLLVVIGLMVIVLQLVVRIGAWVTVNDLFQRLAWATGRLAAVGEPPSRAAMAIGLFAVPTAFAAALGLQGTAVLLYLTRARRVTQARFHRRVPLRAHARFWRAGTAQAWRVLWMPALALWATYRAVVRPLLEGALSEGGGSTALLAGTALALLGALALVIWLWKLPGSLRRLHRWPLAPAARSGHESAPVKAVSAEAASSEGAASMDAGNGARPGSEGL